MLDREIHGQPYQKSQFRKSLLPKLNQRSEGSIEFKHQNISAVLLKYKLPYIIGYKPRANYQALLEEMVLDYLLKRKELDNLFEKFSNQGITTGPEKVEYAKLLVAPPQNVSIKEPKPAYLQKFRKPNYLEIEQRNQKLGELGEELVIQYEKWRLIHSGKENLAEKVEWVSKESGDGAGFDILSRNENGSDRYIEVKTTKLGELTPFYFSKNELRFSQNHSRKYYLYRVFKFNQKPNLFIKNGSFDEICHYEPTNFMGRII
ncbi:MAG: DUF3883 domain-containing protein [Crocinitomicaceae bacterium]|nr:DUF3883 domain-containing protein [Crocinitomicaceae bacterium]MCB0838354.1 DUF3883 domain-containing protein [Bacteroidota bacterium]